MFYVLMKQHIETLYFQSKNKLRKMGEIRRQILIQDHHGHHNHVWAVMEEESSDEQQRGRREACSSSIEETSSISNGSSSSSSCCSSLSTADDDDDDASSFSPSSANSSGSSLDDLSDLMSQLPIKRGLSKFYHGKSESFTSLARVTSIEDLPKKEKNPYNKRMKMKMKQTSKSYGGGLDSFKTHTLPKPIISKKLSRGSSFSSSPFIRQRSFARSPLVPNQQINC